MEVFTALIFHNWHKKGVRMLPPYSSKLLFSNEQFRAVLGPFIFSVSN